MSEALYINIIFFLLDKIEHFFVVHWKKKTGYSIVPWSVLL